SMPARSPTCWRRRVTRATRSRPMRRRGLPSPPRWCAPTASTRRISSTSRWTNWSATGRSTTSTNTSASTNCARCRRTTSASPASRSPTCPPATANRRVFQYLWVQAHGADASIAPPQDWALWRVHNTVRGYGWMDVSDGDRPAADDSDEALMARIARGDERAYRVLARRHLPAMLGLARRILGNAADAEDVAQEAMLRVWTHAPRWQPLAQFRTWLTRVVVNLCLDRKRRAPWVALEAAGDIVDPSLGPGDKAESDERERLVKAAIAELPARQRAAITLTYGDGMSNAQVAEILGTSVSAVETLLMRGKQNMRRALDSVIDKDA